MQIFSFRRFLIFPSLEFVHNSNMTKSATKTVTKAAPKEAQKNANAAAEFGQIVSKFFEDYHKSTPVKESVLRLQF